MAKPKVQNTKTKKTISLKRIAKSTARSPRSRAKIVAAEKLGIAPEQLLASTRTLARISPSPAMALAQSSLVAGPEQAAVFCRKWDYIRRPLVPQRTSFWLGVGFGVLVIGVLGYLAWKLFNVEITEAIVLGLGM